MLKMIWKGKSSKNSSPNSSMKISGKLIFSPVMIGSVRINAIYENDETYEIEFRDHTVDHLVLEYHKQKGYIFVKSIIKSPNASILRKVIRQGDILLAVNNHVILDDEISDISAYFDMLKRSMIPRKLTLLSVSKCSFNAYMDRTMLSRKTKKDMFGFNRTLDYLVSERQQQTQQGSNLSQRDLEWVEYLKAIGGPDNLKPAGIFKPSKELKALVRRGIPVAYRSLVWQKISLSSLHRREYGQNYYSSLLMQADKDLDFRVRDDIEKDIDRTFPEHEYFGAKGGGEDSLRRILTAYATHNPDIGYCQSLNFVGGIMLLFMEEEDAFWLLLTIIETLLPKDYYTRSMIGTYTDQYVLGHIIELHLPQIHQALENAQLQLPLVTVQWFMCLFVNTLRPEIALRVWDMFLNEGSKVLFRIAIALFKLHEKTLLEAVDAGDLFLKLRDIGKDVLDPDLLISTAYEAHKIRSSSTTTQAASTRKRNDSNAVSGISQNMLPPKDLTGLGLAHLGPIPLNSLSNSKETDANNTLEGIASDYTSDETHDDCGNTPEGDESHQDWEQNTALTASLKVKSRSISFIRGDDGSVNEVLVADMSRISRKAATTGTIPATNTPAPIGNASIKKQLSAAQGNVIPPGEGYHKFSRRDIEIWRTRFRNEVVKQFQDMDTARKKWKEEQHLKKEAIRQSELELSLDETTISNIDPTICEYVENDTSNISQSNHDIPIEEDEKT